MNMDPFQEYIKQTEPNKRDKGYAWHTAIGLQAVDGLKPSEYLIHTAIQNIEGEISIDEAQKLLDSYYEENPKADDRTEEADKVSVQIAKILSEKAFSFTPNEYISIHKKLFTGIYKHAGKIRDYNITKKEWVLNGATAVFFIKYLRTLGFETTNDIFAENAWYFRNALVRANYNDLKNGVHETTEYLELFLRNLLLDEKNELHNRTMHISGAFQLDEKADIEGQKADIRAKIKAYLPDLSENTIRHILLMYGKYGNENIFGRSDVEKLTGLKSTRASELLKMLLNAGIIQAIKGHGKGKYRF